MELRRLVGSRSVVGEAPGHHSYWEPFQGPSSFFLTLPPPIYPIAPGDIEVFKDMELTSLNLYFCSKLTGVFGLGWGMVGGVKIGNRLRPQAITQIRFWELSSPSPSQYTTLSFFLVSISGDIGAFANMPLKILKMEYCGYNPNTGASSITGESCSQQGVAPGPHP